VEREAARWWNSIFIPGRASGTYPKQTDRRDEVSPCLPPLYMHMQASKQGNARDGVGGLLVYYYIILGECLQGTGLLID